MRRADWILLFALMPVAARAADYVWVEAESADKKVEHANEWYEPVDRQTSLSGGDWWRSFDEPVMDSGYMVCPLPAGVSSRRLMPSVDRRWSKPTPTPSHRVRSPYL